jgi:hypothetical protein
MEASFVGGQIFGVKLNILSGKNIAVKRVQ